MQRKLGAEIKNVVLIVLGIASAAFGLKGFLLSSRFIDGGVTGVSMLLADILGFPLAILIAVINLPFVFLGYRTIGRAFAIRSSLAIIGLSLCLAFVKFPDVTPDSLLTAVFGGIFIGAGIGLAIRGNAVLDGTEIAALLISKRSGAFKVGDIILMFNIIIFGVAAFVLSDELAMYSILTYISASKMLEFVLHGIEEYHAVTVVSPHHEAIRKAILADLGRGVTVYQGRGGLSDAPQDILYCVVTRLELGKIRQLVQSLDHDAFIIVNTLVEVQGGLLSRRHH